MIRFCTFQVHLEEIKPVARDLVRITKALVEFVHCIWFTKSQWSLPANLNRLCLGIKDVAEGWLPTCLMAEHFPDFEDIVIPSPYAEGVGFSSDRQCSAD